VIGTGPGVIESVFGRDPGEVVGVGRLGWPGFDERRQAEAEDPLGVVQGLGVSGSVFGHAAIVHRGGEMTAHREPRSVAPRCGRIDIPAGHTEQLTSSTSILLAITTE